MGNHRSSTCTRDLWERKMIENTNPTDSYLLNKIATNYFHESIFDTFWREIVTFPNGAWNEIEIKRQLADYYIVMNQVMHVYQAVTGGQIVHPMSQAEDVVKAIDTRYKGIHHAVMALECQACNEARAANKRLREHCELNNGNGDNS